MTASVGDSGSSPKRRAFDPADPPEPDVDPVAPPRRRWWIALRNALGTGLGSVLLSLPLKYLGLVPEIVVVRLFAIVTLVSAVAYGVRTEMHVELLVRHGAKSRAHRIVVALEVVVALAFLACGPYCFAFPDGGLQFAAAAGLLSAVFGLALAMSWLVRNQQVVTGTAVASYCWLVRFIRDSVLGPLDHVNFFKWLNKRWDLVAPKGKVSYLTLWLCASLVTVASANSPRVAPVAWEALGGDGAAYVAPAVEVEGAGLGSGPAGASTSSSIGAGAAIMSRPAEEEASPSYEQLCGNGITPGQPAPRPQRTALYRQWLSGGVGAIVAGCPRPARELSNHAWYAVGMCGDSVRSLAVATPRSSGALLLWAPARFAFARAASGTLLDATSSRLVGEGEVYSVQTTAGTYLFMRDHLSDGEGGVAGEPRSCVDLHEGSVPYVVLPPALARLWSAQVKLEGFWIWGVLKEAGPEGGERFIFRDPRPGTKREIVGYCRTDTDCELRVEGVVSASRGTGAIDVEAVFEETSLVQ